MTIQIEAEFSALSVYEVFRAIPALLPYQNNDFRGVTKKTSTLCPLKKIIATWMMTNTFYARHLNGIPEYHLDGGDPDELYGEWIEFEMIEALVSY